mgnify:CR=1 FL=1
MTLHLGIMGWGTIGEGVGRRIADGAIADVSLTAILRQRKTDDGINMPAPICRDLAAFLAAKPDLVLEAAGGDALRALGPQIVENGVSLVVMSAAALGDDEDWERVADSVAREVRRHGAPLPSAGPAALCPSFARPSRYENVHETSMGPATLCQWCCFDWGGRRQRATQAASLASRAVARALRRRPSRLLMAL